MSRAAELQLPLNDIHQAYPALVRALAEAGETPPRIQELLSQHLRIRCLGCGQAITADDLSHLGFGDPTAPAPNPTVERLRLGYCARPDCKSRFYHATATTGIVAWPAIFQRTQHFITHPPAPIADPKPEPVDPKAHPNVGNKATAPDSAPSVEDLPEPRQLTFKEKWRRLQFTALAATVALGLLFWWWNSGLRIPGLGPTPRQFEVISSPGDAPPAAAVPAQPAPGAPRSFRSQ
jgi:hypothetical protein